MRVEGKKVLGFAGLKFAGKTTAANAIQSMYNEHVEVYSFAYPLKQMCKEMFGLTHKQMTDPITKETVDPRWNLTPRQIMQNVGKMFRDVFGKDFWVNKMYFNLIQARSKIILIDDVRYENEAKLCDVLCCIYRDSNTFKDQHESENPPYHLADHVLINDNGTASGFSRHVRGSVVTRIVQEWLSEYENI